jgi:phosphate:Na+ symporter
MSEISVVINILGAAALLLWGLRMVGTGVTRTFGADLRRWINLGTGNRLKALLTGLVVTIALQSSTATCLMAASFAGRGLMDGAIAQSIMLGANVGTSAVAKLLTFDLGPLSALLVLVGVGLFRSGPGRRRHLARILIGLGLMLLSLRLLDLASLPLRESARLHLVLHDLDGLPLLGLALAAGIALLAHSSIASILLILPLAAQGAFGPTFGLALILGANLGSALAPVLETGRDKAAVRRVPLGNALVRLAGCAVAFALLDPIARGMLALSGDGAMRLVDFHLAFNLALAVLFLPLVGPVAALVKRLRPDAIQPDAPGQPKYLDERALETPSVAIAAASRETLRVADLVQEMLQKALEALRANDLQAAGEIARMDDVVDALHQAVKLYLARLSNEDMDEAERGRASDIMTFAINLEHIGDIIDRNLRELAEKKIRQRLSFSPEGFDDLTALFAVTLDNLKVAMTVFVTGDLRLARRLIAEKAEIRALERRATEAHLARIGGGRRESIETSTLHLDLLRDLKRINAHIASVAYPILEQRGELVATRLRPQAES